MAISPDFELRPNSPPYSRSPTSNELLSIRLDNRGGWMVVNSWSRSRPKQAGLDGTPVTTVAGLACESAGHSVAQAFLDTEEVGGSNPPAPTRTPARGTFHARPATESYSGYRHVCTRRR
jgi:hypothetical protein